MPKSNEENNQTVNEERRRRDDLRKAAREKEFGSKPPCFVGSTPILTPEGWRPISDLKKGDRIVSYDKSSGATTIRHVKRQRGFKPAIIWEVRLAQRIEPICTTQIHSFLTNRGWKQTNQLRLGDILATVEGEEAVVTSIIKTSRAEPVFSLITEGEHTYVVQGCVVHNFTYFRNSRVWWHRYILRGELAETQNYVEVT